MAEIVEQVHHVGGGAGVVDVDAGDAEARVELAAVDDRRAARRGGVGEGGGGARQAMAEENQPVGLLAVQHQRVALLAALVVLRVADQHRVVVALRRFLDALQDQREERIGDVGHRDQQLAGARRAQVLGGRVGNIAERFDGLEDLELGADRDDVGTAEHPRDGGRGHPGAFGDFVDV